MRTFDSDFLLGVSKQVFIAYGASESEAAITAKELIEANLFGLDSHGFIRTIFYADEVEVGRIRPQAQCKVLKETDNTAVLDACLSFGQVAANAMVDLAESKARKHHIACIISRHAHHVGRLGAYTQKLAERGFLSLAMCNGYKAGHFVAPFGGCEGRLATNPFSYAVPSDPNPLVFDMSTSMIAEGKIRVLMHENKPLPPHSVINATGTEAKAPKEFYGPPRGAILPFGGELGYKGFGLGLMVEFFGGVLADEGIRDEYTYLNGLCLIAIDPEAFWGLEAFKRRIAERRTYLKSSKLAEGSKEILLPGEYDFKIRSQREQTGIPIPESVWEEVRKTAMRRGLILPDYQSVGKEG